jgi:hypothetical protein
MFLFSLVQLLFWQGVTLEILVLDLPTCCHGSNCFPVFVMLWYGVRFLYGGWRPCPVGGLAVVGLVSSVFPCLVSVLGLSQALVVCNTRLYLFLFFLMNGRASAAI